MGVIKYFQRRISVAQINRRIPVSSYVRGFYNPEEQEVLLIETDGRDGNMKYSISRNKTFLAEIERATRENKISDKVVDGAIYSNVKDIKSRNLRIQDIFNSLPKTRLGIESLLEQIKQN